MSAPDRTGIRLLRSLVLTGSSVGLGALAHADTGATQVAVGSSLALLVVLALSWAATARRVTWPVIALILAGGQALTHGALSAGPVHGSHAHGAGEVPLPTVTPMDGRMVLAHLVAWAALTLLFTRGERALWRSVRRLVTPWPAPLLPLPRPRRLVAAAALAPVCTLAHRRVRGRAPPPR